MGRRWGCFSRTRRRLWETELGKGWITVEPRVPLGGRQTRTAYDGEKDDGGGVFQRGWAEGGGGREAQGQTIRQLYVSLG